MSTRSPALSKGHSAPWTRKDLCAIRDLFAEEITAILDTASALSRLSARREIKKVPALRGKTMVNFFVEPSTRTRTSFELAAFRLSADVVNISATTSSLTKGETLKDTARNLEALHADIIVLRHSSAGAAQFLAEERLRASVVNGGDGAHEHPTQALLDTFTIREHKRPHRRPCTSPIIGDILFSRVARSNIHALTKLGARVTLVGPSTLVPREFEAARRGRLARYRRRPAGSGCGQSPAHPARTPAQGVFPEPRRIHSLSSASTKARAAKLKAGLPASCIRAPSIAASKSTATSRIQRRQRDPRSSYQRSRRAHGRAFISCGSVRVLSCG